MTDESTSHFDAVAAALDSLDPIILLMNSYRARMLSEGYSKELADQFAVNAVLFNMRHSRDSE
jgi:hypothetical protein